MCCLESRGLVTGMLETRFWPRQGTMACRRRSSSCLGRSTCYGVPHQSRRRLSCRKRTKRPRLQRTTRSSGRTDGCSWDSTTRSSTGRPSRPGAFGQAPVGVTVERKRLRARRRRCTYPWRRLRSQRQCRLRDKLDNVKKDLATFRKKEREKGKTSPTIFGSRDKLLLLLEGGGLGWTQCVPVPQRSGEVDRFRDRPQSSVQPAGLSAPDFFVPARRSHAPVLSHERSSSAPTGGCSTGHGRYGRFALAPSRRSTFLQRWVPRHSDHGWKACQEAGRAASRLDPASEWDQGRSQRAGGPETSSSRS